MAAGIVGVLITACLVPPASLARGRTITLVAVTSTCNINAGVNSKCRLKLKEGGKSAGSATWDCAFESPFMAPGNSINVCTDTYKLKHGSIVVHYKYNVDHSSGVGRHNITSGTGAYRHASGTVTARVVAVDTFDVTIKLR